MKPLYHGCHKQSGHYVWNQFLWYEWEDLESKWLRNNDGILPPQGKEKWQEGAAALHHLEGKTVLSFWDYSVDSRPGSHSTFLIPEPDLSFDDIVTKTKALFPEIWQRFKFQVVLVSEVRKSLLPDQ